MLSYSRIFLLLILTLALGTAVPAAQAQSIGNCEQALGEAFLDVNNVRARILNNGGLFWRGSPHVYEVPKGAGANAIFASGIWLAGEVGGQLRAAATRYGAWEFWGGPLDEQGNPPSDCARFDRVYKVSRSDVDNYEETGSAPPDLRDWPTGMGAPTLDADGNMINMLDQPLAQRIDRVIDLAAGERPGILGDQSIWWVMNDRGNSHESTDAPPIGVEVHGMAFAFNTAGDIGNTTFYKYNIFYKGDVPLENAYLGIFSDPDLGNFDDDYVGSDTTLGLGYVYNSDNEDEGGEGYGTPPPAAGYDFFQGPIVPSAGDTAQVSGVKIPDFKNLAMTSFMFYNNGGGVTEDPQTGADYYNYMQGNWKDGQKATFGGNGRDFSTVPTNFMFTGDPESGIGWSEINPDPIGGTQGAIDPGDRRFVMSTGPFTINPGDQQEIIFGVVWAKGADNLNSVTVLRQADALAQAAFDVNFELPQPPSAPSVTITELDGEVIIEWDNGIRSNNFLNSYSESDPFAPDDQKNYTFQGYDIIQYNDVADQVGKVIATYDVADGVTRVIDGPPGEPTVVTATGNDTGLQQYHQVRNLTNYKTYHFGVQAYAFNEPSFPKVYRGPITRFTAVPARPLDKLSSNAVEIAQNAAVPDIVASKEGIGGGSVTVDVINPGRITGEDYRVEFIAVAAGKAATSVVEFDSDEPDEQPSRIFVPPTAGKGAADVTSYDIFRGSEKVFDGAASVAVTGEGAPQGQNVQLLDGLSFNIAGPPRRELQWADQGIDDHAPVFIEVVGPGGADPCGPDAVSTFGCDLAGGNNVWVSFNGTGEYILTSAGTGPQERIGLFAPSDFEIRITEEGSLGYWLFQSGDIGWVPFEVWDVGPVGPFGTNDPSDDIQMVPVLFSDSGADGNCLFAYGEREDFGRPSTDRIYAYHPVNSYDTWAAIMQPLIDADPDGCAHYTDESDAEIDFGRNRALQRVVYVDNTAGAVPAGDLTGSIVRFHTTKPNLPGDMFTFSTQGLGTTSPTNQQMMEELDNIGIVPNPYKGVSEYERSQLIDEVRFTNLPTNATIRVFTLHGTLIKTINKNSPERTVSWDLTTDNNLSLASGLYLVHIEVPGLDSKVVKFAVARKRTHLNVY